MTDKIPWLVVVNTTDPRRHEIAWCRTPEYAEGLAADMRQVHGFQYAVEEHSGDETCVTCQAERTWGGGDLPEVLCYAEDSQPVSSES